MSSFLKILAIYFIFGLLPLEVNSQEKIGSFVYDCETGICKEIMTKDSIPLTNFTLDNKIYKDKLEFVYTYKYIQNDIEYSIGNKGHILELKDETDLHSVAEVSFMASIKEGQMWRDYDMSYKQTVISYNYYNNIGGILEPLESSGLIENEKNIWLHPFRRSTYFAMLNMNAYPYVKFPLKIGDTYFWELKVGGAMYTDPIWAVWEGSALIKHEYIVVGKIKRFYAFSKEIEVYVIRANSTSRIGESNAEFLFNEEYGFVEMKYYNINNSTFHFTLDRIIQK